jgi:hypothetical protein
MERFIHEQKLANYRKLIAESNLAVTKDEPPAQLASQATGRGSNCYDTDLRH